MKRLPTSEYRASLNQLRSYCSCVAGAHLHLTHMHTAMVTTRAQAGRGGNKRWLKYLVPAAYPQLARELHMRAREEPAWRAGFFFVAI